MLSIHPDARTTPAVRAEIARSSEPTGELARRYGVSTETVREWRKRGPGDCLDRSARPHKLPWKAGREERAWCAPCAARPASRSTTSPSWSGTSCRTWAAGGFYREVRIPDLCRGLPFGDAFARTYRQLDSTNDAPSSAWSRPAPRSARSPNGSAGIPSTLYRELDRDRFRGGDRGLPSPTAKTWRGSSASRVPGRNRRRVAEARGLLDHRVHDRRVHLALALRARRPEDSPAPPPRPGRWPPPNSRGRAPSRGPCACCSSRSGRTARRPGTGWTPATTTRST